MTKYHAKKTEVNGITFASRLEAERFQQLRLLEMSGQISGLMLQVEFQILKGWVNPGIISQDEPDEDGELIWIITSNPQKAGEKIRSKFYVADFVYYDKELHTWVIEDTKGVETAEFRLKWDYMKSLYPEYLYRKVRREDV